MLAFRLLLSKSQQRELIQALARARTQGHLTTVNRLLALLAIAEGNHDLATIAHLLRVSTEAIRQWLKRYLLGGVDGLIAGKRSPGRPSKLTPTQRQELDRLITEGPEKAGFPGACWRSPMIQELIYQRFGVLYNVKYLSELLKNMGFSFQKARFAVGGKDEENQQKRQVWKEETWPSILARAQANHAYLLFGDEASFPQWGSLTYTWAKKGEQPTVKTSGIRKGYKVFGLVDYFTGRFFYKTQTERLNSVTYIAFLQQVLAKTRKPLILIHDQAPYHTSKAVRQFCAQHAHRLTVYELPSYSPDYNPIEKLWKQVKTERIHLHYFPTFESLTQKVEEALLHFADTQQEVFTLFGSYTEEQKRA